MGRRAPVNGGQRGSAVVEFALLLPLLALLTLGTADLGRVFRLQTRLINSAREGAALAQFRPANVDPGCEGGLNIVDRALAEDGGLAALPEFRVEVLRKDAVTGALTPYLGCRTTTSVSLAAGDVVLVRVRAAFSPLTPVVSALLGAPLTVTGSQEVVIQG